MLTISESDKNFLTKLLFFLIAVLLFCSTFLTLTSLLSPRSFGHDESVYLTKARSWIEGTPANQFEIYRPIGMAGFGWFFLQFSNSEIVVRSFGAIFGAITILFIFLFFKKTFNVWVATVISIVVSTSLLFLREAPQFFNDIPLSGFLIGILWLLYIHYKSAGKSRSIYFTPFFASLAFYIRYGTITALGTIAIISTLILLPKFIKKEAADFSKIKNSLLISVILFTPHFIEAFIATGSPLGILSLSGKAAQRKYLGEGLINYIKWLPNEIGGWVLGITAIIGIVTVIVIVFNKNLRQRETTLLWIGGMGLLNFLITGLLVHAETRYVFFSMVLLSGTGIAGMYYLLAHLIKSKAFANALMVSFLIITLSMGVSHYNRSSIFFRERLNSFDVGHREALQFINNDNTDKDGCAIWLIRFLPTASWYSKCSVFNVSDVDEFEKDFRKYLNNTRYSIVHTNLKETQISPSSAEEFGVVLKEIFRIKKLTYGDLIVYRIERKDSDEEEYLRLLEMDTNDTKIDL